MAPKNKKKNSFYFFMKEIQEREEKKGCRMTMTTLPNYAHPIWKKMSLAEREPYEEMARKYKNDPGCRGGRLASDGTSIELNLLEEKEKEMEENRMKQNIKQFLSVDLISKEQFQEIVPRKLIYFMSFNILCCYVTPTDTEEYIPIEVGIIEYSIQDGISREYSKILYPGHPPTGYAGIAKQLSEEKHQIDIFGEECGEKDMSTVWEDIRTFLNPLKNDEYPPLFCQRSALPTTRGCLKWLATKARSDNPFQVWDATYLLMELRAGIGNPLPSNAIALDLLNKTSFDYHPSTRCDFHDEKDIHYCALSYSKKLCYLISDAVCHLFEVELTEKHIPNRAVEDKAYTITTAKVYNPPIVKNPVRLDKQRNYYQNAEPVEENVQPVRAVPRQPASTCIAEEMNRLRLNMGAATVPGHGIGRGIRKN